MFFSRQIGLSEPGAAIPILVGSRVTDARAASVWRAEHPAARAGTGAADQFHGDPVRPQRCSPTPTSASCCSTRTRRASGYNRVAGVDTNFRFGQLSLGAYAVKTTAPQATTPGSGEDFSARANFNYQSRTWIVRGAYEVIGERFRDELGFVPRLGVNHAACIRAAEFPADVGVAARHSRDRPALPLRPVRAARRHRNRIAVLRLARRADDERQRVLRERRQPEPRGERDAVRAERRAGRDGCTPGIYDFNEYFALYRSNNSARFSYEARYSDGGLYDGHRRGYSVRADAAAERALQRVGERADQRHRPARRRPTCRS